MNLKLLFKQIVQLYLDYNEIKRQTIEVKKILAFTNRKHITSDEYQLISSYYKKFSNFKIKSYWHELYINTGQLFDVRFLPADFLFTEIIPRLNSKKFIDAYADKNQYELFFRNVKHPKTILKRIQGDFIWNEKIISNDQALTIISSLKNVIIKPTINTQQGQGVFLFNSDNIPIQELKNKFINQIGENYIIQEKVIAHPIISSLNPSSLNTIRMITYRQGSKVKMLSATLKIGKGGEIVDNGHAGGFFCGITSCGKLRKYLYTLSPFNKYEKTETGIVIDGIQIPHYNKLKDKVCELALKLPYAKYVGWDMAIDENGEPVLIELNLKCPGINIMQIPNGPIFGNETESILKDICKRPKITC